MNKIAYIFVLIFYSALYAQQNIVFDAQYDIYYRGFRCGRMHAELTQEELGLYRYKQHLNSAIFFYPFEQIEESFFSIKNNKIHSQKYTIQRHGLSGPSYQIRFEKNRAIIEQEDGSTKEIPLKENIYYCDRLVSQLVLIRAFIANPSIPMLAVNYPELDGLQQRWYLFQKTENGHTMQSIHKNKASSFELSEKHHYFPYVFQQFRKGDLVFEGEVSQIVLTPLWEIFNKNQNLELFGCSRDSLYQIFTQHIMNT